MATTRRSRWAFLVLSAVLLASPLVPELHAKKTKSFFKTVVIDKRLKGSKRFGLFGSIASTSFSIAGATKPKRGVVRTLAIVCGPVDLRTVPAGTTLTCYGDYTEAPAPRFREWSGQGIQLTVESFDGSRLNGTFQGLLTNASTANPSGSPAEATVEGGTFSLVLTDVGV